MIRIWKISDNGHITVATDCTTPESFEEMLSAAIIKYTEEAYPPTTTEDGLDVDWGHDLHHDMPQIISGAFAILLKLKGYKTEGVGEERLLYSGHAMPPVEESHPHIECR